MKEGDLINFFEPKRVAIVGASEDIRKVGGILLNKSLKSLTDIVPINPNHDEVLGKKCYKSLLDFGGKIDLVVVAVPATLVSNVFLECGKKKIKNIILISAGFSEVGNSEGVKKILEISKKYGINFIGSNCFGSCNTFNNLDLTFSANMPGCGDVAFISQSGALWSYVSDFLKDKIGFSKFVSLGNMENLEFSDFIEYFSKDKKTKSIVLYVEKLKDGKRFMGACEDAIKKGKKIYVVKGGSSNVGEKAAISHTASLASDYEVYRGAFKQCGAILCESLLDAFVLSSGKKIAYDKKELALFPTGSVLRARILTNAGGAGVLLSDYLARKGVEIIEKPLDILGTARAEDYAKAFSDIKGKDFETLFVVVTPQSMTDVDNIANKVVQFKKELSKINKRVVAVFLGGESMNKANEIFRKNGIDFVNTIEGI